MESFAKVTGISILFAFFMACNNHEPSPYDDLLSKPPYKALTDSIKRFSSNHLLYYRRGMMLYRNSNYPPALSDFQQAWSMDKNEDYAVAVSTVLLAGKPDSAVLFLKDAIKVFPKSIPLQLNLASAY